MLIPRPTPSPLLTVPRNQAVCSDGTSLIFLGQNPDSPRFFDFSPILLKTRATRASGVGGLTLFAMDQERVYRSDVRAFATARICRQRAGLK